MTGTPGPLQVEFERTHGSESELVVCDSVAVPTDITEIAIERTPCYGFCSTYTMTLLPDGSVRYVGQGNVEHLGHLSGKIDPSSFRFLSKLAADIGFFEMNDLYTCMITDSPTVYVSVVRNGIRKTIKHYAPDRSGPARLVAFEEAIDAVYGSIQWASPSAR
jgi:hypothetical protein